MCGDELRIQSVNIPIDPIGVVRGDLGIKIGRITSLQIEGKLITSPIFLWKLPRTVAPLGFAAGWSIGIKQTKPQGVPLCA